MGDGLTALRRLALGVASAVLLAAGCAPLSGGTRRSGPPVVEQAGTGEVVVRVGSPIEFDDVARLVYDDASLGPAIAELSRLPYAEPVPAGSVLVLPPASELATKRRAAKDTEDLFRKGLASADLGAYEEAAGFFREALAKSPGRADIQYNYGLALSQAGELNEATRALQRAAAQRPGDADYRYAYGSVLRRWREHERALTEFDAALAIDSDHASAAYARAMSLEDLERPSDALRAWRRFVDDFPSHKLRPEADAAIARLEKAR